MRSIRSEGTAPERQVAAALRALGLAFSRRGPVAGGPDFTLPAARVALFVHGCFWHACPRHGTVPRSSFRHAPGYWRRKLEANKRRDRVAAAALRRAGWRVAVVWEHDAGSRSAALRAVARALGRARRS